MYIALRTIHDGHKLYYLRIWLEDLPNKLASLERAHLECTCETHTLENPCIHARQAETQFQRTLAAERRKLLQQLAGGRSVFELAKMISAAIGHSIEDCLVFALHNGSYAFQISTGIEQRYNQNCGWGTGGHEVILVDEWPLVGLAHILKESPDFPLVQGEVERQILLESDPMDLPPEIFGKTYENLEKPDQTKGNGLIDLFDDWSGETIQNHPAQLQMGQFWAAVLGFRLESFVQGSGRYLPDYTIGSSPAAAIALDLARGRLKLLSFEESQALSEGIPRQYRQMICKAHLPWGVKGAQTAAYQVILRHPSLSRLFPDEPVEILTTNLWLGPNEVWPGILTRLFAQAACLLMRMGHQGDCWLHHGTQSMSLEKLAESAICSTSGGAYPTNQREWALLEDAVIPAVCSRSAIKQEVIQQFGPEWSELIREFERN